MRTRDKMYRWTGIAILVFITSSSAQSLKEKPTVLRNDSSFDAGTEERLVRLAYKKLTVYAAAAKLREGKKLGEIVDPTKGLRFRLSKFRSDRIDNLKDTLATVAITPPTEEIIQLIRSSESLNDREQQVAYRAKWVPGKYASMADRNWTIGDVLRIEAARYYDVTRYTSYTVDVTFEGKQRTYQAVVFHHGNSEDRRLEFHDTVVGLGGTLTSVWEDQYLPQGFREEEIQSARTRESFIRKVNKVLARELIVSGDEPPLKCPARAVSINECSIAEDLADFWNVNPQKPWDVRTGAPAPSTGNLTPDATTWYATDYRGHISGTAGHYGWAQFAPRCVALENNMQRCEVLHVGPEYGDNEENHSDWWYHVGTGRQQSNPRTGPRGQNVQCETGVGVAFDTCTTRSCGVTMTLGISGQGPNASVTISGGSLWNAGRAEGLVCNVPATTSGLPGGCNQSAEYGCMSGFINVGGICTRSPSFVTQCTRFGDYDPDACACTGDCYPDGSCSPIVVDVLGNGFSMTDASTGVFFDMSGRGTAHRFSWTAESSDDAWLALDRNNNGSIDSGKELFGNVTAQDIHAEGIERNGFLALALYDSAAYGGNGDGMISGSDSIFSRLKLWRDDNHNGVSESCELFSLPDLGLEKIDLDYRSSRQVDEHGNEFRYRSKVRVSRDSNIGRWAWDVFLVRQP